MPIGTKALSLYQSALAQLPADRTEESTKILRWLGRVYFERGEYEPAMSVFERSLLAARKFGPQDAAASALNAMAVVAESRGRLDVAEVLYRRASGIAQELGDAKLGAILPILVHERVLHAERLEYARAVAWYRSN